MNLTSAFCVAFIYLFIYFLVSCSRGHRILFMNSSRTFLTFHHFFYISGSQYCSWFHKYHFSATFSLKMGFTILFTHLKIILLQCFQFQFSVSATISSIQTDPLFFQGLEFLQQCKADSYLLGKKMFLYGEDPNKRTYFAGFLTIQGFH